MRYVLPDGTSSISVAGVTYAPAFGVVDLPASVIAEHADHLAAHGLSPEPETTAEPDPGKRPSARSRKD